MIPETDSSAPSQPGEVHAGAGNSSGLTLPGQAEVTMEVVAQKAGVSRATVSRALRNHPAIPLATRQRVKKIADDLGYAPNPFVAALMSQLNAHHKARQPSSPVIALISKFPLKTGWRANPSVTRMVEGAFAQAKKLGFRIDTFSLAEPGMTDDRLSRILITRGIRGVIVLPTPKSGSTINLNWPRFSSVALGYSLANPKLHRVCNHLTHTIATALDRLIGFGYQRIGMAMQLDTDDRVDHMWRAGYLLYREMFPKIKFIPMLLTPDWSEALFDKWFLKNKPEVVVTDDVRARDWLKNLGSASSGKIGLVLLDRSASVSNCAGIDQRHELMGAAAVDLVVEQLYRNETGVPPNPKYVTIEGAWVNGPTLLRRKLHSNYKG